MSAFDDLLANPAAEKRFLVVLTPYRLDLSALAPLYYSTHGFISGPADSPANTWFEPRVTGLPKFQASLFSEGKLSGASAQSEASLVLSNADGALDGLRFYSWVGRSVRVLMGGVGFALSDYRQVLTLSVRALAFGEDTVTFTLRDAGYLADREVQPLTFAGTGGAEGPSTLSGRRKPTAWGYCRNVTPVYLGVSASGLHQFGVGCGKIGGVVSVYDRGNALVYAASPAAGQFSFSAATGTITLGGAFNGPITADVIGRRFLEIPSTSSVVAGRGTQSFDVSGAGAALQAQISVGMQVRVFSASNPENTWMNGSVTAVGTTITVSVDLYQAPNINPVSDWVIAPWGTAAGALYDIAAACGLGAVLDMTALQALNDRLPISIGYWLPEGGNGLQLLDAIADATACFWRITRDGLFQAGRVDAPGTPIATLDKPQQLSLERLAVDEPAYQVTLRVTRNWTVMTTDQIAGAALASSPFLTQEWRQRTTFSATAQASFVNPQAIIVESCFEITVSSVANAECLRLGNLFIAQRDYFRVRTKLSAPLLDVLNASVSLVSDRYGLQSGKALRVIDHTLDLDADEIELGLWG